MASEYYEKKPKNKLEEYQEVLGSNRDAFGRNEKKN